MRRWGGGGAVFALNCSNLYLIRSATEVGNYPYGYAAILLWEVPHLSSVLRSVLLQFRCNQVEKNRKSFITPSLHLSLLFVFINIPETINCACSISSKNNSERRWGYE